MSDEEFDEEHFAAKIDGISKGLRMGNAEIYGELLAFDQKNSNDGESLFALSFFKQQAAELGQSFDEFMDEQNKRLEEFNEYKDMLNNLYEVSDKYGYKEED